MADMYILSGHQVIPCIHPLAWADWFENANRCVQKTVLGDATISTVFLGLNHNLGKGPPLVFETIVFGGPLDQECERYSTWEEAEEGHNKWVEKVKGK